jgi:hypothetical protein
MNKLTQWIGITFFLILLGCQPASIAFHNALPDPEQQTPPFPPTIEELRGPPQELAFTPWIVNPQLSRYHQSLSIHFVQSLLEQEGGLFILPEYRTSYLLNQIEFRDYDPTSLDDAMRLAQALKVDYIAILKIQPSLTNKDSLDWATYLTLKIYQVQPQQLVMQESINFEALNARELWNALKSKVQKNFPRQGYILETRNQYQYIHINLGMNQGVHAGRSCGIFRRTLKTVTNADGSTQTSTAYERLGTMKVMEVHPDTAWGVINPDTQAQILTGDVVFTDPE